MLLQLVTSVAGSKLNQWTRDQLQKFCAEYKQGQFAKELSAALKGKDGRELVDAGKKAVIRHLMKTDAVAFDNISAAAVANTLFGYEKGTFQCSLALSLSPSGQHF